MAQTTPPSNLFHWFRKFTLSCGTHLSDFTCQHGESQNGEAACCSISTGKYGWTGKLHRLRLYDSGDRVGPPSSSIFLLRTSYVGSLST